MLKITKDAYAAGGIFRCSLSKLLRVVQSHEAFGNQAVGCLVGSAAVNTKNTEIR